MMVMSWFDQPTAGLFANATAETLPAADYYSSAVPDAYPIRKALAMLHRAGFTLPDRVMLNDPKLSGDELYFRRSTRAQQNMFVNPQEQGQPVHVNAWTLTYDRARKNKADAIRQLAAQFAHEAQHQHGGPDEAAAYDRQLDALTALGGTKDELRAVRDAAEYARRQHARDADGR